MANLTKRQLDILDLLYQHNDYLTIKQIADSMGVSKRSVQNDLDYLADFCKENEIALTKKSGAGIFLSKEKRNKEKVKMALESTSAFVYDKNQRINFIAKALLENERLTYQKIADDLMIARQTVVNYFSKVEKILRDYHLDVSKEKGVGIQVAGAESDIRKCFLELIREYNDKSQLESVALEILEAINKKYDVNLMHFDLLATSISFIIRRIKSGKVIENSFSRIVNDEGFYAIIMEYVDEPKEINYIGNLILSENINEFMFLINDNDNNESDAEAKEIANYLLESLTENGRVVKKESINDVVSALTNHLKSTIYRFKNNIVIENELTEQIHFTYPLIFEFTSKCMSKVEKKYGYKFNDAEIAYLTVYLAYVYEKDYKDVNKLNVLLVCSFGIATSQLLKNRLLQNIPQINVIGPCSYKEAVSYLDKERIDLIVTTADLYFPNYQSVIVNPLLNNNDVEKIKNHFDQQMFDKMCNDFMQHSQEIVHFIGDYIEPENIQITDKDLTWQQAIKLAAKPLVNQQKISQKYVERMIEAVNEYGTYMVMSEYTAYVHASKDDGIKENCVSVLVLDKTIDFGYINTKRVKCIVVLGIINQDRSDLLNIVYILNSKKNVDRLLNDKLTVNDIRCLNDGGDNMKEAIKLENIHLGLQADDWRDAVRKSGKCLVDSGAITDKYIKGMVDAVEELGPYMVLIPGFALAHSAPCSEVKQNALSLATFNNDVVFGCDNDPVRVVMCLASTDGKSHVEMLQNVAMKLMDEDAHLIDKLISCDNSLEAYKLINS